MPLQARTWRALASHQQPAAFSRCRCCCLASAAPLPAGSSSDVTCCVPQSAAAPAGIPHLSDCRPACQCNSGAGWPPACLLAFSGSSCAHAMQPAPLPPPHHICCAPTLALPLAPAAGGTMLSPWCAWWWGWSQLAPAGPRRMARRCSRCAPRGCCILAGLGVAFLLCAEQLGCACPAAGHATAPHTLMC